MKVFISWSGDRSKAIADVLRRWFPSVLQAVRPYFSPDDVAKGSRWATEISKELESSRIGLLIITPENQEAPWLLFEAGALSKNLERSKVCPLLFDGMEPTDVKGPLVQFQAAQFSKDEMKRVIKMMNGELADAALASDVLDGVFEMWWPRLEEQVRKELEGKDEGDIEARRSERDLLEEILGLTRRMSTRAPSVGLSRAAWEDMSISVVNLARVASTQGLSKELSMAIHQVIGPMRYIEIRQHMRPFSRELRDLVDSDARSAMEAEVDPHEDVG